MPQVCRSEVTDSSENCVSSAPGAATTSRQAGRCAICVAGDSRAGVPDPMLRGAFGIRHRGTRGHRHRTPSATTWITRGSSTTIGYSNRMSDSADASYSALAAESVCSRTEIGMISTPLLWWRPGYGLVVGVSRACHRCARRCRSDRDVLTEQGAALRRGLGGLHEFLGADPVPGVVPRRARQHRVRLGRMRQRRRAHDVRAVEVGVEADRVIAVARQRPDAVVVDRLQRLGDGMGQHRVRADLDEGGVLCGRRR